MGQRVDIIPMAQLHCLPSCPQMVALGQQMKWDEISFAVFAFAAFKNCLGATLQQHARCCHFTIEWKPFLICINAAKLSECYQEWKLVHIQLPKPDLLAKYYVILSICFCSDLLSQRKMYTSSGVQSMSNTRKSLCPKQPDGNCETPWVKGQILFPWPSCIICQAGRSIKVYAGTGTPAAKEVEEKTDACFVMMMTALKRHNKGIWNYLFQVLHKIGHEYVFHTDMKVGESKKNDEEESDSPSENSFTALLYRWFQ